MDKKRVHFAAALREDQRAFVADYLRARALDAEFVNASQLWQQLDAVEWLIVGRPPRLDWARATRLRLIHVAGSGVDPLFPAVGLRSEVVVSNSRGAHAALVSEHVFALLLTLFKDLPRALTQQVAKSWKSYPVEALSGKKLCVVGLGEIGRRVVKAATAFGMRVVGVCNTPRACAGADQVYGANALAAAVAEADAVVLCVPLTSSTRAMFDASIFEVMKTNARLINVSRGAVVDEQALLRALQSGQIQAALDVFEEEPLTPESPLWHCPGIVITPHIAGYAQNYLEPVLEQFVAAVAALEQGVEPNTRVDRVREY
jgi:phosphoglycerate dehydrogenase-like enzyme